MRTTLSRSYRAVLAFAAWGWPLLAADFLTGAVDSDAAWARALNTAAFLWILAAACYPIALLFDKTLRERAMARLCGLKEGDERERAITGEAARGALILGLALQSVLLVLSLVSVSLTWDPARPAGQRGMLSVGLGFSTSRHLDPSGSEAGERAPDPARLFGGYLISPSAFPLLAVMILLQLAAFRFHATRRYEGLDS
jgi:hypothetical protein